MTTTGVGTRDEVLHRVRSKLTQARRRLREALRESEGANLDSEERELLGYSIHQVVRAVELLAVRVKGKP